MTQTLTGKPFGPTANSASSRTSLAALALSLAVAFLGSPQPLSAAESELPLGWPEFHGEASRGFVVGGEVPRSWGPGDYAWRRDLGSRDVGSPVIADGRVFYLVSRPDRNEIAVEAADLDSGELRWSRAFPQNPHPLHRRNTLASGTPTVDGDRLFVAWSDPEQTVLRSFGLDGEEIWSRDFGRWQSQHGFGTSPRVFGSMVLLFNSQQAEQLSPGEEPGASRMIAVDRDSGETLWESELKATRTCYGVPAIYRPADGPVQIVNANTGNGLFGLDAATGKMLWSKPVFSMRVCGTPLIVGDIAIGTAGSGGGGNHLVAVRIPEPGGEPEELYRIERGAPYVPTPAVKDGSLYMVSDNGIASCVDPTTGETRWMSRIGGTFGASPVIIGNTLLLIDLDGKATLLRAAETFEKLGQVDLGGYVGATPAFADGRLVLRVDTELRCLPAAQGVSE